MRGAPCVVSVADHAGWAHVICVAASGLVPVVIARRRVTLIDPGVPKMPYEHESVGMKDDEANALMARVRRSIAARTTLALQRVVTELSPTYAAVALAIRKEVIQGANRRAAPRDHVVDPGAGEAAFAEQGFGGIEHSLTAGARLLGHRPPSI